MNETTPPIMTINDELLAELEQLARKSESVGEDWVSYADLAETLANQCDIDYIAKANPSTILALLQHVRELKADAERYRFIRSRSALDGINLQIDVNDPEFGKSTIIARWDYADDLIDAARSSSEKGGDK